MAFKGLGGTEDSERKADMLQMGSEAKYGSASDRRRFLRLDVETKVSITATNLSSDKIEAMSKNMSVTGICFTSSEKVEVGAIVGLEIVLQEIHLPVHLDGVVAWSKETVVQSGEHDTIYDVGVKLINLDNTDEGKFLVYMCGKMMERVGK